MNKFAGLFWVLTIVGIRLAIGGSSTRLTDELLIGKWEGGDTNGLHCIVKFEKLTEQRASEKVVRNQGQIYSFEGSKHLSTVNFWWNRNPDGEIVALGVNGEAKIISNDQLQLSLRPVNTNITTVSDVVLSKVAQM